MAALRLFAETAYFKSVVEGASAAATGGGTSKDECDAKVAELLAVLR